MNQQCKTDWHTSRLGEQAQSFNLGTLPSTSVYLNADVDIQAVPSLPALASSKRTSVDASVVQTLENEPRTQSKITIPRISQIKTPKISVLFATWLVISVLAYRPFALCAEALQTLVCVVSSCREAELFCVIFFVKIAKTSIFENELLARLNLTQTFCSATLTAKIYISFLQHLNFCRK